MTGCCLSGVTGSTQRGDAEGGRAEGRRGEKPRIRGEMAGGGRLMQRKRVKVSPLVSSAGCMTSMATVGSVVATAICDMTRKGGEREGWKKGNDARKVK